MDWLKDSRTNSWSVAATLDADEYLDLVRPAHEKQGNIQGQRPVQATASARRIRQRLVGDLRQGAVLPPVVVGLVIERSKFNEKFPQVVSVQEACVQTDDGLSNILDLARSSDLSIIDGMQRTAAMMEARKDEVQRPYPPVRVEFWIAHSVAPLIYRMLILNTGQLPWTIGRQITVIHAPLLKEIKEKVTSIVRVLTDKERRSQGGEYSEKNLGELYMAFTLRKHTFDTKERVADEFSRLDFIETLSDPGSQGIYYRCLDLLARFDVALSRYSPLRDVESESKISRGRSVFDSEPARMGFMIAFAVDILGRPGGQRDDSEVRMDLRETQMNALITRIDSMNESELGEFLELPMLEQALENLTGGQIGRLARSFFHEAFALLLMEECKPRTLEVCWRAYA
ncbi:MAG: hypothetical protein EON54_10895 [Alcaligenaceae bacterium]|nr:MAG: hypothetical protein EON54_10895 [Alcaligenaceae bacterium]